MTAVVNVISPVLIKAGQFIDGASANSDVWVKSGEHEIDSDFAQSLASSGYVEVISVNGVGFVAAPCCADH